MHRAVNYINLAGGSSKLCGCPLPVLSGKGVQSVESRVFGKKCIIIGLDMIICFERLPRQLKIGLF